MQKKVKGITILLLAVFLSCLTFSPVALAKECKPANNCSGGYYQKLAKTIQQYKGYNVKNSSSQPEQYCWQSTSYQQKDNCTQSNNCAQSNSQPATVWQQTKPSQAGSNCQQPPATAPAQTSKPTPGTEPVTPEQNIQPGNSAYAAEVVRLVNVERANYGLEPLTLDSQLAAAAQIRAGEANTKFSHTRPNGKSCFSVLSELGISYRAAGENIAIGQSSPAQVVKAWMDSPGHRANILGDYSKIGVGVMQASGNFRGYAWAQFFTR